jgi:hypothetical protein
MKGGGVLEKTYLAKSNLERDFKMKHPHTQILKNHHRQLLSKREQGEYAGVLDL